MKFLLMLTVTALVSIVLFWSVVIVLCWCLVEAIA